MLDAVFQRYLPLARTLAGDLGAAHDPGEAMQAAEVGSAQPVLGFGWRRPDVQGSNWFDLFASTSIAA